MRALLGILLIFGAIGTFCLRSVPGSASYCTGSCPASTLGIGMLIGVITIGFTAQLFARISSMPLDDPLDDVTFAEPFTPQRITYLIDPTPPLAPTQAQTDMTH